MREEEGDGRLGAEDEEEEEEVVEDDLEVVEEELEVEEEEDLEEEEACLLRYKWRARAVVESPPRHRFTERSIVAICLIFW